MNQPVIVWPCANGTMSAGTSWLNLTLDGAPFMRLRGAAHLDDFSLLLKQAIGSGNKAVARAAKRVGGCDLVAVRSGPCFEILKAKGGPFTLRFEHALDFVIWHADLRGWKPKLGTGDGSGAISVAGHEATVSLRIGRAEARLSQTQARELQASLSLAASGRDNISSCHEGGHIVIDNNRGGMAALKILTFSGEGDYARLSRSSLVSLAAKIGTLMSGSRHDRDQGERI